MRNALRYLDEQLQRDYDALRKQPKVDLKQNHLADLHIQALYARSFWPNEAVAKPAQPAYDYYRGQAATYWPAQTRYLQALTALALHRQKSQPTAVKNILTALTENALHSPGTRYVLERSSRRLLLARSSHRNPGHPNRGLRRSAERSESGG